MKYKAIIFDMDGTIIDSSPIWRDATKYLIESKGAQCSIDVLEQIDQQVHGLAMHKTCLIIKEQLALSDSLEDLMAEKTRIACSLYEKGGVTFIPGFIEFHAKVVEYKLKTGIATNADDKTLAITKNMLKLDRFFGKHIYNISHVNNVCKPNPALYLYAAEQLGLKPSECLAIEDSAHGINAAKAAGMFCIGINTSGSYEQVKSADLIIDSYNEIKLPEIFIKSA